MKKQRGVSLGGLVMVLFVLFFVAVIGLKVGPPYMEFATIQKILKVLVNNPELKSASPKDISNAFDRARSIDNVTTLTGADLEVSKDGANLMISASYSVKVPLVANVSILLDFAPTSTAK